MRVGIVVIKSPRGSQARCAGIFRPQHHPRDHELIPKCRYRIVLYFLSPLVAQHHLLAIQVPLKSMADSSADSLKPDVGELQAQQQYESEPTTLVEADAPAPQSVQETDTLIPDAPVSTFVLTLSPVWNSADPQSEAISSPSSASPSPICCPSNCPSFGCNSSASHRYSQEGTQWHRGDDSSHADQGRVSWRTCKTLSQ